MKPFKTGVISNSTKKGRARVSAPQKVALVLTFITEISVLSNGWGFQSLDVFRNVENYRVSILFFCGKLELSP